MNHAFAINHGVAIGREGAAQSQFRIEHAILVEVNYAQRIRFANRAGGGLNFASQETQQRGFAAAIGTDEAYAHSGGDGEMEICEQVAAGDVVGDGVEFDELLGLAFGGREVNLRGRRDRVRILMSASSPIMPWALSMRAFDFVVRALGPRRSHSISVRTRFSSAS